ncbi:triosephosphate isomerase [Dethiosulfatibacter aminovorans DSM 17477]|uniref:Triosephosphate isomerase n=1 Tax=Dethiosulfatibacter aminovorans DSM 17477 TaxID=1121476 RepID=A0A1M6FD34_9FIRM|nr:triose-phosphate isomerase [Dethiosulfatibacter aminovorans]SHI95664.1 triosephosphate isomerase [Dethiosulfatibacter aminovorans DSM 17477]
MRRPIMAGNWKMNNTVSESVELVKGLIEKAEGTERDFVVCPPYTALYTVSELIKGTEIKLGAQNIHFKEKGAYTGEVSPLMLKELNVEYVIIGHSERRQYFGETDETVNKKIKTAFEYDMKPIVCVGESLAQREGGIAEPIVKGQLVNGLKNIDSKDAERVVIAYEPIWAIGTGRTATSEQANDMIKFIRSVLAGIFGKEAADTVRIQYGGSVKPGNVKEIMAQSDIDGALVGGASLKVDDFAQIMNY